MIREGDKAPDFTLDSAAGDQRSLQEALQGNSRVVLVFLRYLG